MLDEGMNASNQTTKTEDISNNGQLSSADETGESNQDREKEA
jgi:hypothetical protein